MKYKCVIFTKMKNESTIEEWLIYHLKLGFSFVFIYDDHSIKSIETILENSKYKNFIKNKYEIITAKKLGLDIKKTYLELRNEICEKIIPKLNNFDFTLKIDVDEFLVLNKFSNLDQLIDFYEDFDLLQINWLIFGNNGHVKLINKKTILDKFTKSNVRLHSAIKSFCRSTNINQTINAHCFSLKSNTIIKNILNEVEQNTQSNSVKCEYSDAKVFIAHFMVQDCYTFVYRKMQNPYYVNKFALDLIQDIDEISINLSNNNRKVNGKLLRLGAQKYIEKLSKKLPNKKKKRLLKSKKFKKIHATDDDKLIRFFIFFNAKNKNIVDNDSFKNFINNNPLYL